MQRIIYAPARAAIPSQSGLYKSTDGGKSWSATGLVNFGYTSATAIDPFNPNVVYVSTQQEMFKSTDGGANWLNISEGLNLFYDNYIACNAISPTNPDNLYIGTFSGDFSIEVNGVLQSTNGGLSWSQFNPQHQLDNHYLAR